VVLSAPAPLPAEIKTKKIGEKNILFAPAPGEKIEKKIAEKNILFAPAPGEKKPRKKYVIC
jgi:hypothetical protein